MVAKEQSEGQKTPSLLEYEIINKPLIEGSAFHKLVKSNPGFSDRSELKADSAPSRKATAGFQNGIPICVPSISASALDQAVARQS
jgi:hypothetical protein